MKTNILPTFLYTKQTIANINLPSSLHCPGSNIMEPQTYLQALNRTITLFANEYLLSKFQIYINILQIGF
jgi:hypothetical protein